MQQARGEQEGAIAVVGDAYERRGQGSLEGAIALVTLPYSNHLAPCTQLAAR